jgi:hypothetical protein
MTHGRQKRRPRFYGGTGIPQMEFPSVHLLAGVVRLRRLAFMACLVVPAVMAQSPSPEMSSDLRVDALPDAPGYAQAAKPVQEAAHPSPTAQSSPNFEGQQTKRILFIVPNFRAVSADVKLPPQSVKDKFVGASEDSFDYSSFIFAGLLAGVGQAENSTPEFHQGMAGYGRYFWHTFADQTDENYQVEFVFPCLLRQDSRYYTLGHGGFLKRTAYSFGRIVVTRTDGGRETFNTSEIVGAGAAAGLSDLYYPAPERDWTKTGQRWLLNVSIDGATFIFKEFWPDLNSRFFHEKD